FLADRVHTKDRLFAYDKRVSAGLQLTLSRHVTLDLSGGDVFDRFFFLGQGYSDPGHKPVDVGAGPMGGVPRQGRTGEAEAGQPGAHTAASGGAAAGVYCPGLACTNQWY